MSTDPKANEVTRKFTSWKFDVLNAAASDPRIPPTYFRMLVRILAALNEGTRIAILGDDLLADEVPGFAHQTTCTRARKLLAETDWIKFEPGRGSRATRYQVLDVNVAKVRIAIDNARERRELERDERARTLKLPRSKSAPVRGKDHDQPRISLASSPAPVGTVHLQGTPSPMALRVQDMTQVTHDPDTGEVMVCWVCQKQKRPNPMLATHHRPKDGRLYCSQHAIENPNAVPIREAVE